MAILARNNTLGSFEEEQKSKYNQFVEHVFFDVGLRGSFRFLIF